MSKPYHAYFGFELELKGRQRTAIYNVVCAQLNLNGSQTCVL